jgi:predicted Zn finger-like uncharacterized protein
MFTVCPKCALTLVVTAADLRVAQGYVRCGRCSSVFNALARLSDERQAGAGARAPAAPPDSAPADTPEADATSAASEAPPAAAPDPADTEALPDDALEFNPAKTDVMAVFVQPAPNPEWTAVTGSFKAMLAANQEPPPQEPEDQSVDVEIDAAFLAAMLKSEPGAARARTPSAAPLAAPVSAPPLPAAPTPPSPTDAAPTPGAPPPRPAAQVAAPAATTAPAASATRTPPRHATPHARPVVEAAVVPPPNGARLASPARAAPTASAADLSAEVSVLTEAVEPSEPRWLSYALRGGVVFGVLLLVLQILNHHRDELATSPRFYQSLTRLYGALGVHLVPHWDVHAYDVRQLGAAVDPGGGVMTVRASIKNGALQAQPLPLLRVTLEDRFGNRIAARDVPPRYYLPPAVPASSFLSAGQRIDAEMGFLDPGANAVGFEIDACLPASGGGIACANDAAAR